MDKYLYYRDSFQLNDAMSYDDDVPSEAESAPGGRCLCFFRGPSYRLLCFVYKSHKAAHLRGPHLYECSE